jgi:hypothetical protein
MKKVLFLLMFSFTIAMVANAQDDKDKVKKTTTPAQTVHNAVSEHKKYKGYKTKHKHLGHTTKHKVDLKEGEVKDKKS